MPRLSRVVIAVLAAGGLCACAGHGDSPGSRSSQIRPSASQTDPWLPPADLMYVHTCGDFEGLSQSNRLRLLPSILAFDQRMGDFDSGSGADGGLGSLPLSEAQLTHVSQEVYGACGREARSAVLRLVIAKLAIAGELRR